MLRGVRFKGDIIETETVVMRSVTGTVRWIRAEHRQLDNSISIEIALTPKVHHAFIVMIVAVRRVSCLPARAQGPGITGSADGGERALGGHVRRHDRQMTDAMTRRSGPSWKARSGEGRSRAWPGAHRVRTDAQAFVMTRRRTRRRSMRSIFSAQNCRDGRISIGRRPAQRRCADPQ